MQNFPEEQQLAQGMGCPTAARDLMRLYEGLRRIGRRTATVMYLNLCMLYRFFFFHLANRLMVTVAFQVREMSLKIS